MSIATLYRTLQDTDYFTADLPRQLDILADNDVIPMERSETIVLHTCLGLPAEILERAHHCFYHELALANGLNHQPDETLEVAVLWIPWVARQLNNWYIRPVGSNEPAATFKMIRRCFTQVKDMPFDEARAFALSRLPTLDRPNQSSSRHGETISQLIMRALDAPIVQGLFSDLAVEVTSQFAGRGTDVPPVDLATGEPTRAIDLARLRKHASENGQVVILVDEDSPIFVPKAKLPEILAIVQGKPEGEPTEDRPVCQLCMETPGEHTCGREGCAGLVCSECFHTWHIKHDACPFCRKEYIPLAKREA